MILALKVFITMPDIVFCLSELSKKTVFNI